MNLFKSNKMRYRTTAAVMTAVLAAALVVVNLIVQNLVARYPLKIDVTKSKSFEMTQETKDFIRDLGQAVEIIVLADPYDFQNQGDYYTLVLGLIQQYGQYSNDISVSYVNMAKTPSFQAQYPAYSLRNYDLLIQSKARTAHIPSGDLFDQELDRRYGSTVIVSSRAEQEITSAVYNITKAELKKIAVLGGSDGVTPAALIQMLEKNGYEVEIINFVTETIPPDTEAAILCAPQRDYSQDMIRKLEDFLYNGGKYGANLFYVAGPDQPPLPYLETYFEEWGIKIGSGVVFDSRQSNIINMNYFVPVVDYTDWSILTDEMLKKMLLTIMPYGRPLEVLYEARENRLTTVLLSYSDTSGVQPFDVINSGWAPGKDDIYGPIPAMVVSSATDYAQGERAVSNLVVASSAASLDASLFQSTVLANADYYLNLFNVLTQRKNAVNIISKSLSGMELGITSGTAVTLGIVFAGVIPLALLAAGAIMWMRRRNR